MNNGERTKKYTLKLQKHDKFFFNIGYNPLKLKFHIMHILRRLYIRHLYII